MIPPYKEHLHDLSFSLKHARNRTAAVVRFLASFIHTSKNVGFMRMDSLGEEYSEKALRAVIISARDVRCHRAVTFSLTFQLPGGKRLRINI